MCSSDLDVPSQKRLVAYVVPRAVQPDATGAEPSATAARLASNETGANADSYWTLKFEQRLSQSIGDLGACGAAVKFLDPSLANESGRTEAVAEIQRTIERLAGRVLRHQPKSILEIGCGAGLLLSRLAPRCAEYFATDVSQARIRALQAQIGRAHV